MRLLRSTVLALALTACSSDDATGTETPDLQAARAELLAADRAYADTAKTLGLIDALIRPLAPDVIFLAPGEGFAVGPTQARAALEANPNNAASKWAWTVIRADVSTDGKQGYTFGYSELTLPNGNVLPGRYVAYWERQGDGTWRIAAYKRLPRAAGTVSLTPPAGFETPTARSRAPFAGASADQAIAAIKAADVAFSDVSQTAGNALAFALWAAPNAAQSGGQTSAEWVFGPAAIGVAHNGEAAGEISWAPELADAASSADLGFTIGYIRSGGQVIGKYFSVWQRQATGEWRYVVD